jgi:mono/diheme cytochrome c family protein
MTDRSRKQPRQREYDDPDESNRPLPWLFGVFAAGMVVWGGVYIMGPSARGNPSLGDGRTLAALEAAPAGVVDGAQLFTGKCAGCHQATGQGVAGVFPPLVASDWVTGSDARLVQILLHGVQGPMDVNGVTYNGLMPAWKSLSDEEIAAISTYIRSNWGNSASAVSAELVATERTRTADRTASWNGGAELETMP